MSLCRTPPLTGVIGHFLLQEYLYFIEGMRVLLCRVSPLQLCVYAASAVEAAGRLISR